MGQESGQGAVWMAWLCAMIFSASAEKTCRLVVTEQLGAGIIWKLLHAYVGWIE